MKSVKKFLPTHSLHAYSLHTHGLLSYSLHTHNSLTRRISPLAVVWRQVAALSFSLFLMCATFNVSADDGVVDNTSSDNADVIGLATLSPMFPIMDTLADETIRTLQASDIRVQRVMRDATDDQVRQSDEPALLLAGLDTFISSWENQASSEALSAADLLNSLVPVVEIVRDYQAFLMLKTRNAQELRSRFARAHGAAGPMSVGGLTPVGGRDHLVAMMLMDTVGQDSTRYPYRQYDSLQSMALALLTGDVDILSMPVSQALQIPLEGGISIIATSASERQDVMRNVPTLMSARIDLTFSNYIGLYRPAASQPDEPLQSLSGLFDQSALASWPEQVFKLGLVDDYSNEGAFTVNVARELSRLKRFAQMLE